MKNTHKQLSSTRVNTPFFNMLCEGPIDAKEKIAVNLNYIRKFHSCRNVV